MAWPESRPQQRSPRSAAQNRLATPPSSPPERHRYGARRGRRHIGHSRLSLGWPRLDYVSPGATLATERTALGRPRNGRPWAAPETALASVEAAVGVEAVKPKGARIGDQDHPEADDEQQCGRPAGPRTAVAGVEV